jgi:tetratricopeptide (TPR) repeat protein
MRGRGHLARRAPVRAWTEELVIPTYMPAPPDRNPMFLEKRVYQGSSGRVYPLPFTDRIADRPIDRKWQAVWIENEYLRALVLPELGGRIHTLQDKTNGYDLIYRQEVIKPALVGLAGPWISGGIEFNWPQHHRPATFLPVEFDIEEHADGSKTIWCSDHDPMARMKGMHGICMHPDRAYLELKVRAYNRTPFVQTFLWWANVATRVHEAYQSFFPPDVHYVADHARRSMTSYPLAQGFYYGVNYGERGRKGVPSEEVPAQFVPPHVAKREPNSSALPQTLARSLAQTPSGTLAKSAISSDQFALKFALESEGKTGAGDRNRRGKGVEATSPPPHVGGYPHYALNDLSFYANIPTPCSYMCMGSTGDFFGGYDYKAQAGIVHVANHHIGPGKKQWTWGNHDFGYAWDCNLTDRDTRGEFAPYIEIMAGVYTDNQPDFSFLQPAETKSWSQFWYPIQKIGPAHHANLDAAVRLALEKDQFRLGVSVTREFRRAVVRLERADGSGAAEWDADLAPGKPFVLESCQARKPWRIGDTVLRVLDANRREIIAYASAARAQGQVPPPASEPPAPADLRSTDELYLTGLHLEQYRHATRSPADYWREAVRRDPGDARSNNALGLWHVRRGEFGLAEGCFHAAIGRLTVRNANPSDGETYYNLGLCLCFQMEAGPSDPRYARAYAAFYKATWNQAWAGAAYHALAELDCLKQDDWAAALDHLDRALRLNADNLRARDLKALVLRRLGRAGEADAVLAETLRIDRLDAWARHLAGKGLDCDLQASLDVAHDYARAGFLDQAIDLLTARARSASSAAPDQVSHLPTQSLGAGPLVQYTLAWLEQRRGRTAAARAHLKAASRQSPDYCFPARLEEIAIFEFAMDANPADPRAPYYLGNLLYDRRRHEEAIRLWERSARLDPAFSVVWRNLGIGYFNVRRQPRKARAAYERAFRANPEDARLLFERDQLWKRLNESPARRLRELERRPDLVQQRDDVSVELCAMYNQAGRHEEALDLVSSRKFQPWEGGEGGPLGQHVRSHLALGRQALSARRAAEARVHFEAALSSPLNLGEARHLLANRSDIQYWLGCALAELGDDPGARAQWRAAATFRGDFQEMSVRLFSEMTYYSALAWERLGQRARARRLFRDLLAYARRLQKIPARIDYFATSLPTMLLFDDDLQARQETTALFLQAQALLGLGRRSPAQQLLRTVLARDPNHSLAADVLAAASVTALVAASSRRRLRGQLRTSASAT